MIPSAGVGIVVLTNAGTKRFGEGTRCVFHGSCPVRHGHAGWFAAYTPIMAGLTAPVGDLVGKSPAANPAPAAKLSSYVGVYANPYFGSAEIADVSGHLIFLAAESGITQFVARACIRRICAG